MSNVELLAMIKLADTENVGLLSDLPRFASSKGRQGVHSRG